MSAKTIAAVCADRRYDAALPRARNRRTTPAILREVDIAQNLNGRIPAGPRFSR